MQDHAGETGAGKPAPQGCQSWKCGLGVHSQAQAGLGVEADIGRRFQLDGEFGESDAGPGGLLAPEDPHQSGGAGGDGRYNVSEPPPPDLLLVLTCRYQRKDSPVEALTLSPEPLDGDQGGRKGEMSGPREAWRDKRKYKGKKGKR